MIINRRYLEFWSVLKMNCTMGRVLLKYADEMSNLKRSMVLSLFLKPEHVYIIICSLARRLGILWSRLLCTVIGPCGCHAVARPRPCCVVIGVCGIAVWQQCREWQFWPPALPWLPSGWRGGRTGLVGGWSLCLSCGTGGLQWNMWWPNTAYSTGPGQWHLVAFHLFIKLQVFDHSCSVIIKVLY